MAVSEGRRGVWRRGLLLAAMLAALAASAGARGEISAAVDFRRFDGQPPGGADAVDPTIKPFVAPGEAAPSGISIPIDTRGNGRPDLLICHTVYPPSPRAKQPCRFLRPQPDGSVTDVTRALLGEGALPSVEHAREFVIADFNGDGLPDVFIAAHGYDTFPFDGETNVLLVSNGDGTYADRSHTLPQVPDFTHSACAGDVNGDGRVDIYVGNANITAGPYLLIGNGDGTFAPTQSGLPAAIASAQETYLSCALADVDGDGAQDLLLGTWKHGNYVQPFNFILFNDATGDFTKRPRRALPSGPQPVVVDFTVVDVDRDGRPDLILTSQAENDSRGGFALQILINQGSGEFVDETVARLPVSPQRAAGPFCAFIRLADLDGDGWEDLYCDTLFWDSTQPRAWINDRGGRWLPVAADFLPSFVAGGDLHALEIDGDGRPDFLTTVGGAAGDIHYWSYRNHTPRSVPGEPFGVSAVGGNARATLAFQTPLASGDAPITHYTATCRFGASAMTASGPASPLTVTDLANDRPYLCSVSATSAVGTSVASEAAWVRPLGSHQGLWWNAPAGSEAGWGINFAHQADTLFATWFTYDRQGKPWWLAVTANRLGPGIYAGELFTTTGPPFGAVPFDPTTVTETTVGTATFTFADDDHASFAYAIDATGTAKSAVAQTKNLVRQAFGPLPVCAWGEQPDLALATNYTDLWWMPSESGWGINLSHQGDVVFATWFTYDEAGKPWWLIALLEKSGAGSYAGAVSTVVGAPFDSVPFDTSRVAETTVGSATLTFADGNSASFDYTVGAVTRSKAITRQVFASPGTACQ